MQSRAFPRMCLSCSACTQVYGVRRVLLCNGTVCSWTRRPHIFLSGVHGGEATGKSRRSLPYVNGEHIRYTTCPILGSHRKGSSNHVYSLDFHVTPHQLRHTYITNLLYMGVDPKTVQYLAGHKNSKTTMDIYAKIKYNKPQELLPVVNAALRPVAMS